MTQSLEPLANLNGELIPLDEVRISALDRGFLFGDGVYEVLRVYQGKPWLEEEHFQRLARSQQAIRIEGIDLGRLRQRMRETIAAGPVLPTPVYIPIPRGRAARPPAVPAP